MKIVFVAPEIAPFSKTGGLADVVGSLPIEIQALGHKVYAFAPRYKSVNIEKEGFELVIKKLPVALGSEMEQARVFRYVDSKGVEFYFIDHPEFFGRDELYGTAMGDYPDNDQRFTLFQRGVLDTLKVLKIKPDVIHCHDWQTGLIPVYLKTLYAHEDVFQKTKTVFTVHNLAYQGNFPPDSLPATGLTWDHFTIDRLEYYGKVNFLKGGLTYSDAISTVSERYAKEIQTKDSGYGLEGVLSQRAEYLHGILNGLDYEEWNPETDKALVAHYNAKNFKAKALNKEALQKENRLKVDPLIPVFGVVSRLVDQKGIDVLIAALDEMMAQGIQLVILGSGDEKYHQLFRDVAKHYVGQFGLHIVFDPKMAKHIYAGCDVMIIPSYYEPCGLAQMIALRYGTIPLVRAVGGLADTIQEFDPKSGKGNGFSFEDYTGRALMSAVKRCLSVYRDKKNWERLVQNGMACDFSWTASAKKYIALYEETERQSLKKI